jgi:H+-translocating NAD(P) transhydrogenase subunit beta
MDVRTVLIALSYMAATSAFVIGLQWMNSPRRARAGNLLSSGGMLLAIVVTLVDRRIVDFSWIAVGLLLGTVVGLVLAYRVQMTAMPQMVGILNGFGGGASALVAVAEFYRYAATSAPALDVSITIMLTEIIGAVTFSGSMAAAAKLQEIIPGRPVLYAGQKTVHMLLFSTIAAASLALVIHYGNAWFFAYIASASLVLGVLFVMPIGGADMPVVICLLNSFSGLAGAMAGFVLHNNVLIISGALVGASGIILTHIMCRAMNRPVTNVLFGAFGATLTAGGGATVAGQTVTPIQADEAAVLLAYAQLVIVVPGYGMAVAQAQHAVRQLADQLSQRGVTVKYAIHPVAGRMPGHMNVLLAEANVPYDQLYDMDQINAEFRHADVVLVIGANDIVNPAARTDTSSPLYGMPILNADQARQTIVMKRSMKPGFAGVENELFYHPKTRLLFGDARDSLTKLISAVKAV